MKTKLLVLIFLSSATASFIFGRISANKLSKIETSSKSTQVETIKAIVSTQAEAQKDSTTVKQTIIVDKFYSKKGKLERERISNTRSSRNFIQNEEIHSVAKTEEKTESKTTREEKTSYKPNWELGLLSPTSDYKNPNVDIGYRVFDDFYLHAEANIIQRTGSVGFFILL